MVEGHAPIVAILAMALVTYVLRVGGFLIMSRVKLTTRVKRGLEALPGAIIVSTVVPVALKNGIVGVVALSAAAVTMALVKRDFVAVFAGCGVAALARAYGF